MAKVGYNNNGSYKPEMTVVDILKMESGPWEEVGLRKETLERFGVKVQYHPEEGSLGNPIAIYFPFYNKDCKKVIGYQKKNLMIDKEAPYHFTNIGTVTVKNPMFGQNIANIASKHIYITEGMKDCLSLWQVLNDKTPIEYRDLISVVSVPLGTPNAGKSVAHNEGFIKKYNGTYTIKGEVKQRGPILCMDNDRADPGTKDIKGAEATDEMAGILQSQHVRVLQHPSYINDINDYIKKGKEDVLFNAAIWNSIEYKPEKVVRLYDSFEEGELFKPLNKGVYLKSFPLLMDRLLGIRMNELTLILGDSGSGKSSVAFDIGFEYNERDDGTGRDAVGGQFLEDSLDKTFKRALARRLRIHPNVFKFNPPAYDKEAEQWVNDNFILFNHFGSLPIGQLVSLTKMFIHKYERKIIILDHISLVISGSNIVDERKELDRAMTELAGICEEYEVHIFVVCHINRAASNGRVRDITKPTWKRVFSTDAKGSQALEALSSNIICIDTEILPNQQRGRIRLNVVKNREADKLGICDVCIMSETSGEFIDASAMEYDDAKGLYFPTGVGGY